MLENVDIELVGNFFPGDYFGTIRFGRKEQLFEIRVQPHTPTVQRQLSN
ncbi:hypothetical protein ACVPOS_11915 [Staphylococcus aureus]